MFYDFGVIVGNEGELFAPSNRKHNNHTLTKNSTQNHTTNKEPRKCNCRRWPDECPIAGNCLAKNLVYQADVTTTDNGETKNYIGVTANDFKQRYRNHTKSFRYVKYADDTELSKHIWKLKNGNRDHHIK